LDVPSEEKQEERTCSDNTLKMGIDIDAELTTLIQIYTKRVQRIYYYPFNNVRADD
jgi:hypothetical protein